MVFLCESINDIMFMLIYPLDQVVGHPHIECAILLTCKDIYIILIHTCSLNKTWIPAFAGCERQSLHS